MNPGSFRSRFPDTEVYQRIPLREQDTPSWGWYEGKFIALTIVVAMLPLPCSADASHRRGFALRLPGFLPLRPVG
jgi:hypothetical protein